MPAQLQCLRSGAREPGNEATDTIQLLKWGRIYAKNNANISSEYNNTLVGNSLLIYTVECLCSF